MKVKAHQDLLDDTKQLIVDLRINRGGSDLLYLPFLSYMFPDHVLPNEDIVLHHMTDRNFSNRMRDLEGLRELPIVQMLIQEMERKRNQGFVILEMDDSELLGPPKQQLQKEIIVLIDTYCGSSGDQFALFASQSPLTRLVGRHTRGILDYSNLAIQRFEAASFEFWYPTSKNTRVDSGQGIDGVGVKPDIYIPWTPEHLDKDLDLEQALVLLQKT